jgi:hypothetical protein
MKNKKDEELYTDIALQMMSTYLNSSGDSEDDRNTIEILFDSLGKDYGNQPMFLPSLMYAFMIHTGILMHTIADNNDVTVEHVFKAYALHYHNVAREDLKGNSILKPSMSSDIIEFLKIVLPDKGESIE